MMPAVTDWPWMLPVALLLGALATSLVVVAVRRKRGRLARLAEAPLLARLAPASAVAPAHWRAARLGVATLLAGVAFAGPRWGTEPAIVSGEGIDVVLALDASLSMLATDDRPNRLERMKQEVRRYRDLARSDRIAMLAFAGRSYILTPLTVDDGALELFLDNLDPSIVGQAGSSLSRTITQGTDLLLTSKGGSDRALVIMSDGESFEPIEEIRDAAARATQNGIVLVTVGFGTTAGATIPVPEGGAVVPKRDENDQVVISRYNPETLQAIAEASNGTFVGAEVTDKATRVRAALQRLRATSRTVSAGASKTPRFQWFVAPALLLLLLDTWRAERVRRRRRAPLALAGVAALAGCTWSGSAPRDAAREYAVGRYARSAAIYRAAIAAGDARPQLFYNLGTALVAADSLDAAAEPLERASKPEDAELRFRSWFNLGLGHLRRGLAGAPDADSTRGSLKTTLETYKRALILRPTDRDAKWNYELALRQQEQNGGGGGGGGGGQSNADQQDQSDADSPQSRQQSGGLGEQQAEQLLNAAAREERGVQGRKQRQSRPQPPPGGKDW
ncbi:MAG: VWA domain-containing protein [Gemmatimonadetes bacterium]|jgi:Ca-activated chloride channel family protein|nr:VWA domain-containing protein [Gemmatimonadota bacterium]MBK6842158.1 VWA domain-containing protein [Gemmatimonadota bacterium]MBK9407957.1 VWA domain-containing protein [Gemmatimonadota bacterium]MBK9979022.1 VWA domain-containing protein [Gemmatimonadota bacterium]